MTSRSTWQRHERQLARHFGGERKALGERGADVTTAWISCEAKSWRRLPGRVVAALQQAEDSAEDGQLPIAVIHQLGARHDQDLVIMRWKHFRELYGD